MRSTELILASITVLGGVGLVGCGTTPAPADAFTPSTDDSGMVVGEDAPAAGTPRAVVGTASMNMPADTACLGSNTAPTAGAEVGGTITFQALALTPFPVAMGNAEVYPGASIRATCDGDCVEGTTDAMGRLMAELPGGGWFGYRLAAAGTGSTASVPVIGQFYTWGSEAGGNVTVTAISSSVADIIAGQLNRELSPTTSAVSGSIRDCDGEEVANIQIRFFRGDTEIVSGAADDVTSPRIVGLGDGAIPSPNRNGLTGYQGRFAGIVPSAGGAVRIEAYGVIEDGSSPVLVGCEEVLVEPGTVTVAVMPALRGDYAAGSTCAGRGE